MHASIVRYDFFGRNVNQIAIAASRALSVGGLSIPASDLELCSFRDKNAVKNIKLFSDQDLGGVSTAAMIAHRFTAQEFGLPHSPVPFYGCFQGNISLDLPYTNPQLERSGFAAWRTADPSWTILGRAVFNCEAHAFLALRVKSDGSKYFINIQADSFVASDLFQHRLFTKNHGQWETIYVPFSNFVKTHMGSILKQQEPIPRNNLTTVGLGLIDRIPGSFEICIDRIWATNIHEVDGTSHSHI